ncbi:SDR family oxidoreductase [Pseudomonadota bacterium]|nr:SDR family oxidoreductase [Pseudomonadota bacterium]
MLKNKTILLTGASGGIGSEIAKLLSSHGAKLILVGRSQVNLQTLNDQLGGQHYVIEADISTSEGRQTILSSCQQYEDKLDILINNAGIGQFSLFSELSEDEITAIININLTSTMLLSKSLLPLLLTRPQAQIVTIGSILGSIGFPGSTVYCASKFGSRGFTEALRRELLDTNVSVRYFAPRATKTALNNEYVEAMNDELGTHMDNANDVAQQLLLFLNGESANKYLGWPEKLFVRINSVLPGVVEKSIYKKLAVIKRYLRGTQQP